MSAMLGLRRKVGIFRKGVEEGTPLVAPMTTVGRSAGCDNRQDNVLTAG